MSDNNIKLTARDNGVYHFCSSFNEGSCKDFINWFLDIQYSQNIPTEINLIITSYGGGVDYCFAMIDIINGSKIKVNTIGLGVVASCGFLLFITGKNRILTPNTSILSHQYSGGSFGKEHELIAGTKRFDLTTDKIIRHYKKYTKFKTEKQIRDYLLPPQDVWLSAKEALKFGACDEIKNI